MRKSNCFVPANAAGWLVSSCVLAGIAGSAQAANVTFDIAPSFQAEQVISGSPSSGGTFQVNVVRGAFSGESRGVYEFPIVALAGGSSLSSAQLLTGISGLQSNGGVVPDLSFHGYSGNGVYSPADGTVPFNQIGRTGPLSSGPRSDPLSSSYLQTLYNVNATHLGVMAYAEVPDLRAGISRGNLGVPTVRVTATVPDAGTLVARPVIDVLAASSDNINFVLSEGGSSINTQYLPAFNVDRRGILEYHLGGVPDGATIESAKMTFNVNAITEDSVDGGPEVRLYGYSGDGAATTADVNQTANLIGLGTPITNTSSAYDVALNPASIQALLAGGNDYLGVLALGSADGNQLGFWTNESGLNPARLSITYAVPEPSAMALLAGGMGLLLARRRRR